MHSTSVILTRKKSTFSVRDILGLDDERCLDKTESHTKHKTSKKISVFVVVTVIITFIIIIVYFKCCVNLFYFTFYISCSFIFQTFIFLNGR